MKRWLTQVQDAGIQLFLKVGMILVILQGCAGINVVSIGSDAALDKSSKGFRYCQPAPFLFLYPDGKGGINSEIKFLPDSAQKMSIEPYAKLASIDFTFEFDAGLLKQASATADETVVPECSSGCAW